MTWKRRIAFAVGFWMVMAIGACSLALPGPAPKPTLLVGEHCADLLAAALASPDAPITGAFDCQSPLLIGNAQSNGVKSDADIPDVAKVFGFTSATDIGASPGVFMFLMTGSDKPSVLVVWTGADGLVSGFDRVAHP